MWLHFNFVTNGQTKLTKRWCDIRHWEDCLNFLFLAKHYTSDIYRSHVEISDFHTHLNLLVIYTVVYQFWHDNTIEKQVIFYADGTILYVFVTSLWWHK